MNNSRVHDCTQLLICVFLFSLLSACGGGGSSKGEITPVSAAPPASGTVGTSAPDPQVLPIESTANSSSSETVTQTDITASASQQEATSLNFSASSLVETASPDPMSSEQFNASGAVHLIFKSG
jgi:hypothetical protein